MAETLTRCGVARRNWLAIVLEVFVAVLAVDGGVRLVWDNALGMPAEWLEGTPFTSWTLPGALLLIVVAVPIATAAVLELRRSEWAAAASVIAGAALIGWIGAQLAIMQRYNFLQPVLLGLGLAVLLLAIWTSRHRSLEPKR